MRALTVAQEILTFLKGFRHEAQGEASEALEHDVQYIESCIALLKSGQKDQINEVWRGVQKISKFFGGDYLSTVDDEDKLNNLLDDFFRELLDAVTESRSHP